MEKESGAQKLHVKSECYRDIGFRQGLPCKCCRSPKFPHIQTALQAELLSKRSECLCRGAPFSRELWRAVGGGAARGGESVIKASSDHTGVSVPRLRPTSPAQAKASSKGADLQAVVAAAAAAAQAVSSFWLPGLGFHTVSSC